MSNDEYQQQRLESLAQSVELLAGSTRDLRAIIEADLARTRERTERDRRYLSMVADILKHWAEDEAEHGSNGQTD